LKRGANVFAKNMSNLVRTSEQLVCVAIILAFGSSAIAASECKEETLKIRSTSGIQGFQQLETDAIEILKDATEPCRKKISDAFKSLHVKLTEKINSEYFSENQKTPPPAPKLLTRYGLRIDSAEGMNYAVIDRDYYQKVIPLKLSKDAADYEKLTSEYEKTPLSDDGALAVPAIEISKWIIRWEEFLSEHPRTEAQTVQETIMQLSGWLTYLMPNEDYFLKGKIAPSYRKAYEKIAESKQGKSAEKFKEYLNLIENAKGKNTAKVANFAKLNFKYP
jgi:hypothetical protein